MNKVLDGSINVNKAINIVTEELSSTDDVDLNIDYTIDLLQEIREDEDNVDGEENALNTSLDLLAEALLEEDDGKHERIISGFKIDCEGSKIKSFKISCARGRKVRKEIDLLIDIIFDNYTKEMEIEYKSKEKWLAKKEAFKTMFRQLKVIFNVLAYRGK